MLIGMYEDDNPDTLKPLIDGGTEGKNYPKSDMW